MRLWQRWLAKGHQRQVQTVYWEHLVRASRPFFTSTAPFSGLPMENYLFLISVGNLTFLTVVLEKTLESPLDSKEIKLVSPKGNQTWIFFGKTDAEGKTPILWPPDEMSWLIGKDPDAWKDWRQEKGATEDEKVGWHCQLNEHHCEQTPGDAEGQGSLVCCSPWARKELDKTEWLNNICQVLSEFLRFALQPVGQNRSWLCKCMFYIHIHPYFKHCFFLYVLIMPY